MAEIDNLLRKMTELGASDLHLRVGIPPRWRIGSNLEEMEGKAPLTREDIERLTTEILSKEQAAHYAGKRELDFSHGDPGNGRFRCNYFQDHWGPAAVFRRIPDRVPSLRELNLPSGIEYFAHLKRGLVLVTGASGSGKTTTLAALVDVINTHYRKHVITLEDPIEYLHERKKAVIHQRGMHYDITDFGAGILAALRQDPDVLLIGELRDLPSIRQAVSAAETGVLVLATLHTNSAADSIDRMISVFPPDQQPLVRTQLADSLAGIVCQVLLDRKDGSGQIPATEILITTPAVSGIVREGNTQDLVNVVQSGRDRGMHSLDDSLERLVRERVVDAQHAWRFAQNKPRFERFMTYRESTPVGAR
jgi:twitching motility protein PilT